LFPKQRAAFLQIRRQSRSPRNFDATLSCGIQTNATVVPAERRMVSAEVSGIVQRVLVREGQRLSVCSNLSVG
jgi:multidrug efflux pump subunit AcrA (membrane-fusion protein)